MSLAYHYKRVKNKFNKTRRIVSNPKFYLEFDEHNEALSHAYLKIDAPFKMVRIEHSGRSNPAQSNYNGFIISSGNGKTSIINLNKVKLDNDLLLSFYGRIKNIKSVKVYGWWQRSIYADISDYKKSIRSLISEDDNLIDGDGTEFNEQNKVPYTSGRRNPITRSSYNKYYEAPPLADNMETDKVKENKHNIISGRYTNGNTFKLRNKIYIGYYHCHIKEKKYMTGATHSSSSKVLKKLPIFRERYKKSIRSKVLKPERDKF